MARDQRALKFVIRLSIPILVLGGFGGIWGLVLVGLNQQKFVSSAWSPDRHYRASIVQSSGGCGQSMSSLVLVERQNLIFKTGEFVPFCLDGQPDRISIQWIDAKTLSVQCRGCEELYGDGEPNWGALQFRYNLNRP